jgi:hypothetical protein
MKLSMEKELNVAIEIDDKIFINSKEGILYQSMSDNEILLLIKNDKEDKEVKIKINKKVK